MIITTDNIRQVRPIAQNIDDVARIEPYIREAEALNVMPVIGADVYRFLDTTDFSVGESWTFVNKRGESIAIDRAQYEALIYGGYYESDCGGGHSLGLAAACAYYAYGRAVMNNQVNVTSFGVVRKRSDFSEPVDSGILIQVSREAQKLGDEVLRQVVEQLRTYGMLCDCGVEKIRRKWVSIGK